MWQRGREGRAIVLAGGRRGGIHIIIVSDGDGVESLAEGKPPQFATAHWYGVMSPG